MEQRSERVEQVTGGLRFGGGRFWARMETGGWQWHMRRDLKQRLRVEAGVTGKEAKSILDAIEKDRPIDDPTLADAVGWLRWTRGLRIVIAGDEVLFMDEKSGRERRRMTVPAFNRYVRTHFPTRKPVEVGGIRQLLG